MRAVQMLVAVGLALLALGVPAKAAADTRVALVIANSNYAGQPPLPNAVADAVLVQTALTKANFEVVAINDVDFAAFNAALASFMRKAENADVALVYYAGHGLQSGGKNWLIPTSAILGRDRELMFQAVPLDNIMQAIGGAKTRIIILDACRNNPFTARMQRTVNVNRDVATGLGKIEAPRGSMVMYSAAEGQTASDGPENGNSPFASAFTNWLVQPGIDIRILAGKVADDVFAATDEEQLPFYNASLGGNALYFIPPQPTAAELEMRSYTDANTFATAGNCGPMREHLTRYPNGMLTSAARAIVATCAQVAQPAPQVAPARTLPANYLDRLVARNLAPLTAADYRAAGTRLGVHPATIEAVVRVESGSKPSGFGQDGRLVILFEPHIFSRFTNRRFDASNPRVSYPSWDRTKYPRDQAGRWAQVREAFALDPEAAISATSFGMFGMMGMTYRASGFEAASDFANDIAQSNVNQLLAFEAWIKTQGIVDELQRADWEGFARVYNGAGQVDTYGRLLRDAYARACQAEGASCPAASAAPAPTPTAVTIPPLGLEESQPLLPTGIAFLGGLVLFAAQRRRRTVAATR